MTSAEGFPTIGTKLNKEFRWSTGC